MATMKLSTAELDLLRKVFKQGATIQIRMVMGQLTKLVPAESAGLNDKTSDLTFRWTADSLSHGSPPVDGQEVQVYAMVNGVLHFISGQVVERSEGRLPRLRCRLASGLTVVKMRKHERFLAYGQLQLTDPAQKESYKQQSYSQLDISVGGFGTTIPAGRWKCGNVINFGIVAIADPERQQTENDADSLPVVNLYGRAVVRNIIERKAENKVTLGCQFERLPRKQVESLGYWLAANMSCLRKA